VWTTQSVDWKYFKVKEKVLSLGKRPTVPIGWEVGWAPEPVWMHIIKEKISAPARNQTPAVQPIVSHYTDWASPALPLYFKDTCTFESFKRLQWVRQFFVGFSLQRPRFMPGLVIVGFVGQIFLRILQFSLVTIISLWVHTLSLYIYMGDEQ
jgi:hypothetical protein